MSTTVYFGERWNAAILDYDAEQAPTPTGEPCVYCDEPIVEGDRGFLRPHVNEPLVALMQDHPVEQRPWHRECEVRSVVGSVYDLNGQCPFDGTCNNLIEAEGISKRDDALRTWQYIHTKWRRK